MGRKMARMKFITRMLVSLSRLSPMAKMSSEPTHVISATAASLNRGEYCISKAGLAMAARLWALRLAGLAQVVELRPGIMETDMTAAVHAKYEQLIQQGQAVPMRRWGTPADVGRAVRSIVQGDWPFTTGDAIHIDGGFHLEKL